MMRSHLCVGFLVLLVGASVHGRVAADDSAKPRVLLLGDSISIGYTPFVQAAFKGEAEVFRPMLDAKRPENCSGTTHGVKQIDKWLAAEGGQWDVIHVNFGLHDLKRVDAKGGATTNPDDPRQAEPAVYEKQLKQIVGKLVKTGATVIVVTTTPVPEGKLSPLRSPADVERYNTIAKAIATEHNLPVNDLYAFALPKLKEIQKPSNVHFTDEGSKQLADAVVQSIREALKSRSKK